MSSRSAGKRINSPLVLFLYSLAALAFCLCWQWFFPHEGDPLPYFMARWRVGNGILSFISLFPAFAFSALMVSFGYGFSDSAEGTRFSPRFIDAMKQPLLSTMLAASLYTALCFFVQPALLESHAEMRSKGILFNQELGLSRAAAEKGDWVEASQALSIADRIWPRNNAREMVLYRDKLTVEMERLNAAKAEAAKKRAQPEAAAPIGPSLPGLPVPATVTEAITLTKRALAEGRNFDANWYSTVGAKLAKAGSPEASECIKLGAEAWDRIEKSSPEHPADRAKDQKKQASYDEYARKREGFLAVTAEDWLRAYAIFESLAQTSPKDPDVVKYLAMSRSGLATVAFFRDELASMVIGAVYPGVLFSLPRSDGGRDILHARNLYLFSDAAYLEDMELWHFTPAGQRVSTVRAVAAKWQPLVLEKSDARQRTVLLLMCLDRGDPGSRLEPVWEGGAGGNRLPMETDFADIALIAKAGTGALSFLELNAAMKKLPSYGFVAEGFRVDWLNRLCEPFLFLSLSILVLAFGWRLRSLRGPSFFFVPLLFALPFAMNTFAQFSRMLYETVNIGCVLDFPFALAATVVIALQSLLLLGSLVFLAGQRG